MFRLPSDLPRTLATAMLGLLCVLLVGCGPNLVAVSGVVTLDGKPLPEAGVTFKPVKEGPVGMATTDANGRYTMEIEHLGPGLLEGKYQVTVHKDIVTGLSMADDGTQAAPPMNMQVRKIVPVKYNLTETSGLEVEVKAGQDEKAYSFDLSSQAR